MKKFLVILQSICLTIILLDLVFYFVKGDYLFDTFIWRIIFFGVIFIGSFILSICYVSGIIENEKLNFYINSFNIGTTVLLILLLFLSRSKHIKERNEKALTNGSN